MPLHPNISQYLEIDQVGYGMLTTQVESLLMQVYAKAKSVSASSDQQVSKACASTAWGGEVNVNAETHDKISPRPIPSRRWKNEGFE